MNYQQTLEFLNRRGNEVQGIHLGLHRTRALMDVLGNPQEQIPAIHIAGTNGKGSVAAMAESILRRGGLRTGLYISPHLVRLEERIQINGRPLPPRSFAALATRIRKKEASVLRRKLIDRPLTYFEFCTCCAFLCFAEKNVDVSIIEVGLGGMLDATNIVQPQVSVITGVSYDHQNLLGNTLTAIAQEKAGIIKPGVPVISGCKSTAAQRVIRRAARAAASPLVEIDGDCTIRILGEDRGRSIFDYQTPQREFRRLRLSLLGKHQTRNAALAIAAVDSLKLPRLRAADVRHGLHTTRWPGRLEQFRACRRTLLEGAHNPEGAEHLAAFLAGQKEYEVHLVFGALKDKDIRKMGASLFPLARSIHLTPLANSRSANPSEVASIHKNCKSIMTLHRNSLDALRAAWEQCSPRGLVVVTGSLYLLGEILPLLRKISRNLNSYPTASF
jgi:dihydrofolate synthase / folylpolyglutamate synthase